MKKLSTLMLSAGAIVPLLWFNVIPWAGQYCPKNADGKLVPYTVQRENMFGKVITLVFGGNPPNGGPDAQQQLCEMVANFPA